MEASTMLLLSILLPLAGAILIASIGGDNRVIVRRLALAVSSVTLLLAVAVIAQYDPAGDNYLRAQMEAAAAGSEPGESFQPSQHRLCRDGIRLAAQRNGDRRAVCRGLGWAQPVDVRPFGTADGQLGPRQLDGDRRAVPAVLQHAAVAGVGVSGGVCGP